MNNSVFGKTQENLWNRVNVEIITDDTLLQKRVAKPSFAVECLLVITSQSSNPIQTLTRNRPIFVGFTVLELSKVHTYDFHNNHMIAKYPHANQICVTSMYGGVVGIITNICIFKAKKQIVYKYVEKPNTEPCGTRTVNLDQELKVVLIFMFCHRSLR